MKKQTQSRMHRDFGAFQAKLTALAAIGLVGAYEMRDDSAIKNIGEAIDKIGKAFEEYKKTNDERIEAIKAGKPTADIEAKLAKIDEHLDGLAEQKTRLEKLEGKLARPGALAGGQDNPQQTGEEVKYHEAVIEWMRKSNNADAKARVIDAQREIEMRANAGPRERRAAQVVTSNGSAGGYALPEIIERQINRLSVDISPIRQLATIRTVGSTDYKELVDVGGAGFEWVGEADTRNATNSPDLQEVAPTFGMASARPTATEESLDDLFFDVESWLISSASESIAQGEGAAFINGNGIKKPTGILAGPAPVATGDSTRPFGTLQYIASGQASAMPSGADLLYDLVYSLRARYRANARWLTSKLVLASLRKYKDVQGQYLWQPSLAAGQPDVFLGYPITEAEDMPGIAANSFPIAFGDFKEGYLITDRVGMRITRDELTTPGFVKFYVRKRVGGKLRNTQAIKLLKIAAA